MAFRQQQPVVPRVLDQPAAGLHQPLLQTGQPQLSILFGSTSLRHRFPRLYAITLSHSRTSLHRNRWQLSRVMFTACLPSLIQESTKKSGVRRCDVVWRNG